MIRKLHMLGYGLALLWAIFQLAIAFGPGLPDLVLLPVHALFAIGVTFALMPMIPRREAGKPLRSRDVAAFAVDIAAILLAIAIGVYFVMNADALSRRIPMVQVLDPLQIGIGVALILLVLEAARRSAGLGITVVVGAFIAYALLGSYLPSGIATSALSLADFIDQMVFGTDGVFGVPLSVSATYVFYFVLFAGFLEFSGGGRLFIDIALGLTKNARGGPAKAAVTGSGLMGMASGSAVANVVSTGVFTIPLMASAGYKKRMAAAVEALASTGAQIMPPLMGAAAFIMANTLGVPYSEIVIAATLPALLYFSTVFIAVDFEARRHDIKPGTGIPDEDDREAESRLGRLHLLIPLVFLVVCVVSGRSLMLSALQASVLVVLVSWARKSTRLYPRTIVEAMSKGASRVVSVAVPCAAAGIVVGVVAQTGVGLRFTEFLVAVSGDNLIIALIVVMFGCLIMGMGLPTTAAYIMASTLFAPTLSRMGVDPLAAHMFVFYFACLSMITPPVALASYAAASIAGAKPSSTGWTAAFVGIPLFLLPYAFVTHLELLGQGGVVITVLRFAWALVGMSATVAGVTGHLLIRNTMLESWLLGVAGVLLMLPVPVTNLIGGTLLAAIILRQFFRRRSLSGSAGGADREGDPIAVTVSAHQSDFKKNKGRPIDD